MMPSPRPNSVEDSPVIDMFTSVPTAERLALEIRSWGSDPGYQAMFGRLWADQLGLDAAVIAEVASLSADSYLERAGEILEPIIPPLEKVIDLIRRANIRKAVIHAPLPVDIDYPNDATANLVSRAPDLFIGFVRVDPTAGDRAASEVRRGVSELGLRGVTITPFWHGVRCTDPAAAPIFETAAELEIPVWVHTSMNWNTNRPIELEHPRYVDELAGRYPSVPIICGHGGWPWVMDLVAVAWRHKNVFIDVSAFRPRHIFIEGSGWESLVYFGARTLQRKLLFGSTWTLLGSTPAELVGEAVDGPWADDVTRAWLHDNGARLLQVEVAT